MLDMNDLKTTMRCDVGVYVCSDDDDVMMKKSMSREKIGSPVEVERKEIWLG